jgi:hypothetical protein
MHSSHLRVMIELPLASVFINSFDPAAEMAEWGMSGDNSGG